MIHFEHLISRPAHYQPCPKCGHHTITATTSGHPIRCNPQPLTLQQEITARLASLQTYDVLIYGLPRQMHPIWRDLDRIRAGRKYAVIADHTCTPLPMPPGRQPETEIFIPYQIARTTTGDEPPF